MKLGTTGKVSTGALVVLVTFGAAVACSGSETKYVDEPFPDASFDTKPSADSGLGLLTFMPHDSFSGYDGAHTFTVPLAVYAAADDLVVTAKDPASADITPKTLSNPAHEDGTVDNGKYFWVTVKKPGTITLVANSRGKSVESTIEVASYDPSRWQAGATRYANGGGADPPCTDCHVNGQAVDHSPAALATVTDEGIAVVITTGISTAGFPIKINGAPGHKWTVTESERDGLVTYLRSLTPRGFQ